MSPSETPDRYCSTSEAARLLGVSVSLVQDMVESGRLRAWKTAGGHRRIERDSVAELLAAGSPGRGRTLRLIAVDDDEAFLELLCEHIEDWGLPVTVSTCRNGYKALLEIADTRPDLVLLDLTMPNVDGFQIVRAVRSHPQVGSTDIVAVTGMTPAQIARRGGLPDDITVFGKPPNLLQLKGYIQALLRRAPGTRAAQGS